jgi:hypothetical protein
MSGTFIFTDTIGATFDSVLADVDAGVDAYVRTPSDIDTGYGQGPRLDASILDAIATVDGVDQVALRVNGYARLVGTDGTPLGDIANSPALGMNWVSVDDLNPWVISSGNPPANDDEIVIDQTSDRTTQQPHGTHLVTGAESALHHLTRENVFQLRSHERASLPGLHVLEVGDRPEGAVDIQHQSIPEIRRRGHAIYLRCGSFGSTSGKPAGQPPESKKIALDPESKHHPRSHGREEGMRAERFPSRRIRDVDFDEGSAHPYERVPQRHRRMGQGTRIDQKTVR